jgi:hypothetical protein
MTNNTSESTDPKVFINDKWHIQKCDQISPETNITTRHTKVHIIPNSQVQYIKTSLRAAHENWEGWDVPMCYPGDALAGDGLTCDPGDAPAGDAQTCDTGDPPTWFDDTLECHWKRQEITHEYNNNNNNNNLAFCPKQVGVG